MPNDLIQDMNSGSERVGEALEYYDNLVLQEMPEARKRNLANLRTALAASDGMSAQSEAEARSMADELNMPASVVSAAPERAREEVVFRRISQNELLAQWAAQDKVNATLAREDTDGLVNVFERVKDIGRSFTHGAADLNRALLGSAQAVSENILGPDSAPSRWLKERQEWVKWARPKEVKVDSTVGQFAYDFIRSAPQQLLNIASVLTNPTVALSMMGAQIMGGSYTELREQGVSPQRALASSAANAALQAPLERLSLDRFMGIFRSTSFRDTLMRTLGAAGTEFLTEYIQKYPEVATNLWGLSETRFANQEDQITWFGNTLFDAGTLAEAHSEAVYEGLIGAAWGMLGGGARVLASRQARERAQSFAEGQALVRDAVQASQTKQLSSEKMEEALEAASLTSDGTSVLAQFVYIPPQAALDLMEQGTDILTPLGISVEEAQDAAAKDIDLEVKQSALQARLDVDEVNAALQIMRERPDAPSLMDVLGSQDVESVEMQAAVEEAKSRKRKIDAVRREEMRLIGEMTPLMGHQVAQQQTRLLVAHANAAAQAYGVDAAAVLGRYHVERGTDQQNIAPNILNEAYRNKADLNTFVENSLGGVYKKSTFIGLGLIENNQHLFNGFELQLTSDNIRHSNKHNINWNNLYKIVNNNLFDSYEKIRTTGNNSYFSYIKTDNDKYQVVISSPKSIKNKTLSFVTSYYTTENGIKDLFRKAENRKNKREEKQKTASAQNTDGLVRLYPVPNGLLSGTETVDENSLQGADNSVNPSDVLNQPAYHGSPFQFDSFSTEYIGEGEGAQAHGWGLYFAQDREVSENYRAHLAREGSDGQVFQVDIPENNVMLDEQRSIQEREDDGENLDDLRDALHEIAIADEDGQLWNYSLGDPPVSEYDPEIDEPYLWLSFVDDDTLTGKEIYEGMVNAFQDAYGLNKGAAQREASLLLNQYGVKGITYLGNDDGRCFVVFDDQAIQVLDTFYQNSSNAAPARAQVNLASGVIRLFKGADLSSLSHESAHLFVQELDQIAQDDGSIARERLRSDLEQAQMDAASFAGLLDGSVDTEGARGMLRDVRSRLVAIEERAQKNREQIRQTREKLRKADKRSTSANQEEAQAGREEAVLSREQLNNLTAARAQDEQERRQLLASEKILDQFVRHMDGLEQARKDIRSLRHFADVPEEGPLSAEQYERLQEYAARGFEQYIAEGKAPTPELEGFFARMLRWLKNLYASWRDYVGAELTDDVRRVYDRMLATDVQAQTDPDLDAMLGMEESFLAEVDLTSDERAYLDDLRTKASTEATAKMDRAALRERNRRFREAYEQGKQLLKEDPFWESVHEFTRKRGARDGNGVNKDSLVEYLGEEQANALAKKAPMLVNARNTGFPVERLAQFAEGRGMGDGDADAMANMLYERLAIKGETFNKACREYAEAQLAQEDRQAVPSEEVIAGDSYGQYLEEMENALHRMNQEVSEKGELKHLRRQNSELQRQVDKLDRLKTARSKAMELERSALPESYYRNMARKEIAALPIDRLAHSRFVAALRRAMTERSRAARRGNYEAAAQAMQRARYAFAMMQEAKRARDMVARVEKKIRRATRVKNGTYPAIHTEALRKLGEALGLVPSRTPWDAEAAKLSFEQLLEQVVGDTSAIDVMPVFPDWLRRLQNPDPVAAAKGTALNWKQLNSVEAQEVGDLLDFLVHSAREESKANKESLRAQVEEIATEAANSMADLPTYYASQRDSVADRIAEGWSSIDTLDWQCRKADGFQNMPGRKNSTQGKMETEIYGRLRKAVDKYHERLNSTYKGISSHVVHLLETSKAWEKRYGNKTLKIRDEQGVLVPVPDALLRDGQKGWTADMVLAMALNMGNAGNRERLKNSFQDENGENGLTYDMVSLLLGDDAASVLFELTAEQRAEARAGRAERDGLLSEQDWLAVQGVWDVLGTQWPDTQAAHKRLYGFAPHGVEIEPLALRIGGKTVTLQGGYYPIKYDPRLDKATRERGNKEDILDRTEGLVGVPPAARKGFTMQRAEHTGKSLLLDVASVLQKHLVDSARFIELGYDVRFADRVINSTSFAAEYQRVFGIHDYDRIRPNLKGLVVDDATPSGQLFRFAELLRKHLTYFALGGNLKVASMQLTAVFPAAGDIGYGNVARGLGQLMQRGTALVRDVWAASPYMERRYRNIDEDLSRKAMDFKPGKLSFIHNGKVYTWDDVANIAMLPIAVSDTVVTTAIWLGAYHKKLTELQGGKVDWTVNTDSEHHAEAVAYADSIIAQSNPDNDALSKSAFARDKGVVRLFNAFSGATTKFAQRTRYARQGMQRGRISWKEFARMEAHDMLLPAVSMVVMMGLAQGMIQGMMSGDDDDTEELLKMAGTTTLGQLAMAVPIFGNSAADALSALFGAGGGRRGGLSTALNTPYDLASRAGNAWTKLDGERMLTSTLDIGSYITRIPVGPVLRRGMRGYEQWQDDRGTPLSIIMPRSGQ